MTYKINPEVRKIRCPVVLRFEGGKEERFKDGQALAEAVFDRHYNIESYDRQGEAILICVREFFEKAR